MQPSSIAKFVEPYFPMFETREIVYTTDDYGASTNDLKFQDITAATFSSRCVCVCVSVSVSVCFLCAFGKY